ncbi:hypothetical protein CXU22_03290 [Akkermansia muciniphila]|uniref:Uncharacterized protein n=1 Tax=Akkermansia muciniphila TaxID=239935 RepID=A0A2N8HEX3_9BACT|nr:hypothetical protein CXU22_03290 [Akkermansia muciniphila]
MQLNKISKIFYALYCKKMITILLFLVITALEYFIEIVFRDYSTMMELEMRILRSWSIMWQNH